MVSDGTSTVNIGVYIQENTIFWTGDDASGRHIYKMECIPPSTIASSLNFNTETVSGEHRASDVITLSHVTVSSNVSLYSPNNDVNSLTVDKTAELQLIADGCL